MSNKGDNKHQSDDDQQGQQGVAKMELQKRWEKKIKIKCKQTQQINKKTQWV